MHRSTYLDILQQIRTLPYSQYSQIAPSAALVWLNAYACIVMAVNRVDFVCWS